MIKQIRAGLNQLLQKNEHSTENSSEGFGTFSGVFVPNVTMMFGVILFLRLGVIVGEVGFGLFALIIAISLTLMIITSLSIAMIATNMRVGGGGVYYLISRSLGIEVGGAIGIVLSISQVISLALCTSGFTYSLTYLYPNLSIPAVEVATLVGLAAISSISANLALKTQLGIFVLLLVSAGSVFFGSNDQLQPLETTVHFYPQGLRFWEAFALFYPALTGIEAGMAMSGNLRDPSRSLSVGNITSLLFVGCIYLALAAFVYHAIPLDRLLASPMALVNFAPFTMMVYFGIWGATLSSALGNLLGAPRMVQSLAEDDVLPERLAQGYGAHNEPRWAIALIFVAALFLTLFTTIDQIIPVLTMICLISYGTLNFVAAVAQLINNPSWRPRFRVPWPVPLLGAFGCLFLMLMIDAGWTFAALAIVVLSYLGVRAKGITVSFRDIRESLIFFFSRLAVYRLSDSIDHPLNWHPQILLCTGAPNQQLAMLRLASSMTRRTGILTTASVLPESWEDDHQFERTRTSIAEYMHRQGIAGLVEVYTNDDSFEGIAGMIKAYGIGPLQPNTVLLGMPTRQESLVGLVNVIRTASLYRKNVMLFHCGERVPPKLFRRAYYKPKRVDLWWDTECTESFALMLSFVDTLTTGIRWRQTQIYLRAASDDETAAAHLTQYFDDFVRYGRVDVQPAVHVVDELGSCMDHLSTLSAAADLIFVPLKPITDDTSDEEALAYLRGLCDQLPDDKAIVFITKYDTLDHREIYYEAPPQ